MGHVYRGLDYKSNPAFKIWIYIYNERSFILPSVCTFTELQKFVKNWQLRAYMFLKLPTSYTNLHVFFNSFFYSLHSVPKSLQYRATEEGHMTINQSHENVY